MILKNKNKKTIFVKAYGHIFRARTGYVNSQRRHCIYHVESWPSSQNDRYRVVKQK
ncbi:hypothetical protein HanPSC8_Chr07g0270971 [Helianthus annuus]|nr:hypothetical protein HanPSC8_Chr07g0270971 [Helianthus annuus]